MEKKVELNACISTMCWIQDELEFIEEAFVGYKLPESLVKKIQKRRDELNKIFKETHKRWQDIHGEMMKEKEEKKQYYQTHYRRLRKRIHQ
jgi:biopolymer transport protein ExbB/TolQ